ncbi:MAG: penicillin-binding protein 2 [Acidimicrobiia bacterium]|nr:penicillin-binding protein 2 [Acidimicrobiia bacterium]MDX2466418.1 penicillin-binding protein 2 [Acidimicrobiia bacterium]
MHSFLFGRSLAAWDASGSQIRLGADVLRPTWRIRDVRVILVGVVFIAAWAGVGYRLFQVQVVEAATFVEAGENQRIRYEDIAARRGTIFDRDYVELAVTVDLPSVMADPKLVFDPMGTAQLLAPFLGETVADLNTKLDNPDSRFAYLARHLDVDVADELRQVVEDNDIDGIYVRNEPFRVYPAGDLAAQVLGFVQQDDQSGLEGLEAQYDELLTGSPGTKVLERDPDGNPIPLGELLVEPATAGYDIRTTIDPQIQYAAQQAAADAVADTGALAATIIVEVPSTGEILAMATAPTFDPNDRSSIDTAAVRNRAVTDVFEPGSTLKVITVAAALDAGIVVPTNSWLVPAKYEVEGKEDPYTDVGRVEDRTMSVAEIFMKSSNVGTIQIQEQLGNELHHRYLEAFGLGQLTTDAIRGEVPGLLHPLADWISATAGASTAIGYRVDVTALQMAAVFGTIANNGVWVEPHLVSELIHPDGSRDVTVPRQRPVLSERTAEQMRELLQGVVEQGTGSRASIDDFAVGGKTGTTEKFLYEQGYYSEDDRIASFIGIAPIDGPEIVIAVVLDSPHGEIEEDGRIVELQFGGVSAAPVFARVAEAALQALGVAPDAR